MRALLPNLTAVLLVIHAMIGCCHHHWHSDTECAEAAFTLCASPRCQCGDPCCVPHEQSEQPSQPCNGELECHGVCTYLPTQKTVIDTSIAGNAFDFAVLVPTIVDRRLDAATLPWDLSHTLNESPPPLRLHLLYQTLLI